MNFTIPQISKYLSNVKFDTESELLTKMEPILEENESEIHHKNQLEAETVIIKMVASDSEEPKTGAVAKKKRNCYLFYTKY